MEFINDYSNFGIYLDPGAKPSEKGEIDAVCPVCDHTRKKKGEKKLRINVKKGTWYCQHCSWTGGLTPEEWAKDKPRIKTDGFETLSEKQVAYWKERGISETTLLACNVRTKEHLIKDKKTGKMFNRTCIAFIYTMNGLVMNIKYRDGFKNFGLEKGGQLVPWGLEWIKNTKECIIVEGEPDRLSFFEVGHIFVVSVPNGATISDDEKKHFLKTGELIAENTQSLSYFDECYEYFDNKTTMYIATDADPAGIKLRYEIARRFGADRCKYIDFSKYEYMDKDNKPVKCKDGNDVLRYIGRETLKNSLERAESFPIQDVVTIDDVWDNIMFQFEHGLEYGKSTGFKNLDPHFTWKIGHTIALNGHNNMGKTHFGMNLIILSAILYDWKWGVYSPENYPLEDLFIVCLEIYMGNTMDKTKEGHANLAKIEDARKFIRDHIEFVNNEGGYTPKELRNIKKQMIVRRGIRGFFTDPWNSLSYDSRGNIDEYLTTELSAEIRFAVNHKIINFIGTHPQTPYGEAKKNPTPPTEFEITGGAIWSKKMYEILAIHYNKAKVLDNPPPDTEIYVHKTKNHRLVGIPTKEIPVLLMFNRRCHRYLLKNGEDPIEKAKGASRQETFNWEGF